jgi:hypothetical protein
MIIEVNTKLLDEFPELNSNQLLFLSMVLDKNQPSYQDVRKIVSLISDDEISYLIDNLLVESIERGDSVTYQPTDKLNKAITPNKSYFDLFYDMYPVYVMRKDGTKSYLRANVNKCRHFFNTKCGKSSAMAEHIIKCLDYEVSKRMREGSLSYIMTMWNWLTRSQWEAIEEEMEDTNKIAVNSYGTDII